MRTLSASAQADVYIEAAHEGCDMNVKISRTRFEDLCFDLYKAAGGVIAKALSEAGSATNDVDMVLLAGGESAQFKHSVCAMCMHTYGPSLRTYTRAFRRSSP